jgi:hypothetical protein
MMLAFDFHHRQSALKTTSVVFDQVPELEREDGAHGVDYRVVSAQPHFHDANHLLLKQAMVDADFTKTAVFVTPHRQTALRLRKAGAAMVMNPLTWLDHVAAAHGKSGDVDLFQFMQQFALENRKQLNLADVIAEDAGHPKAATDPYFAYRRGFLGANLGAMPPGMESPDWYGSGSARYQYRAGEAPDAPIELRERADAVEKRRAVLEMKKTALLAELDKAAAAAGTASSSSSSAASSGSLLLNRDGVAAEEPARRELALYLSMLQSAEDPAVRKALHADELLPLLTAQSSASASGAVDVAALTATFAGAADAGTRALLQASLDQFFVLRLAKQAPTLWEELTSATSEQRKL